MKQSCPLISIIHVISDLSLESVASLPTLSSKTAECCLSHCFPTKIMMPPNQTLSAAKSILSYPGFILQKCTDFLFLTNSFLD